MVGFSDLVVSITLYTTFLQLINCELMANHY